MPRLRTVDSITASLPRPEFRPLPAPPYLAAPDHHVCHNSKVALAVESMRRHMTDEGWQIMQGLEKAGYCLCGKDITSRGSFDSLGNWNQLNVTGLTDVGEILRVFRPSVVVVQDKREWEGLTADRSRDPTMRFNGVEHLAHRSDVFKVTILKDAQHDPAYNRDAAIQMGIHAWIVYYEPRIVFTLAPYLRKEHVIRTYHSVDRELVPPFSSQREQCLLSGAISKVYPLRTRVVRERHLIPGCDFLRHPGYHRRGCHTPKFLELLSKYKVAICTSSIYGYALRKIIEATACGCIVITDLPTDETLPLIDDNLVRVPSEARIGRIAIEVKKASERWDPFSQQEMAKRALEFYDYRAVGQRLANDIERMRKSYVV